MGLGFGFGDILYEYQILVADLFVIFARYLVFFNFLIPSFDVGNVEYYSSRDGKVLYSYLAYPPNYNASQTYPAAVILHSFAGIGDVPIFYADLLAREAGYVTIAPDLFRGAASPQDNGIYFFWNFFTAFYTPQERMDDDIDDAIDYLHSVASIRNDSLVSGPGFRFGGSQALHLSKRRAVAATVSLYGTQVNRYQDPLDDEAWGLIGVNDSPVLAIFGRLDHGPTDRQARGFAKAMTERKIPHDVTIYKNARRRDFVDVRGYQEGGTTITAWNQIVDFMVEVARNSTTN